MSRVLNDRIQTGLALAFLSATTFDRGDFDEARRCDEESLRLRRELGINWQLAMILANLGNREAKLGNFGTARAYLEEGRIYQEQGKESYGIAITYVWLGMLVRLEGDWAQAKAHLAESQKLCAQANLPSVSAYIHGELGQL